MAVLSSKMTHNATQRDATCVSMLEATQVSVCSGEPAYLLSP
jgi:hypothetical protein